MCSTQAVTDIAGGGARRGAGAPESSASRAAAKSAETRV